MLSFLQLTIFNCDCGGCGGVGRVVGVVVVVRHVVKDRPSLRLRRSQSTKSSSSEARGEFRGEGKGREMSDSSRRRTLKWDALN